MGAWDTGIFDNDSAADFSLDLEDRASVLSRQDLLGDTLGVILERDIRDDDMEPGYEFGYEVEHALAAAAYVADAKNGRHQFTDNPCAKVLVDKDRYQDDDAWEHIDVGTPPPALVERAVLVVEKVLLAMVTAKVDPEWRAPAEKLFQALLRG